MCANQDRGWGGRPRESVIRFKLKEAVLGEPSPASRGGENWSRAKCNAISRAQRGGKKWGRSGGDKNRGAGNIRLGRAGTRDKKKKRHSGRGGEPAAYEQGKGVTRPISRGEEKNRKKRSARNRRRKTSSERGRKHRQKSSREIGGRGDRTGMASWWEGEVFRKKRLGMILGIDKGGRDNHKR